MTLKAGDFETPTDAHGRPPTVLALDTDTTPGKIAVGGASGNVAIPGEAAKKKDGSLIVRIASTEDCYIKWGADNTAAAANNTSSIFPKGVEITRVPVGMLYLAAIRVDTDGVLTVTVME